MFFLLLLFEVQNLYRDRDEHDAQQLALDHERARDRKNENDRFAKVLEQKPEGI